MSVIHKPLPPIEDLKRLFELDASCTSGLRRRCGVKGARAGSPAGGVFGHGYTRVSVACASYLAHRVVFAIATGEDPGERQIDHIDRDKLNNSPSNLRAVDRTVNGFNRSKGSRRSSPFLGVSWHKASGKFRADINVSRGKRISLGLFEDELGAAAAYNSAVLDHQGLGSTLNDLNSPGTVLSLLSGSDPISGDLQ